MKKLIEQFPLLKKPTVTCKKCFKDFTPNSLPYLLNEKIHYCPTCLKELKPVFVPFKIGNVKGTSIYNYDDVVKSTLFQIKGCYDIELSDYFLSRYSTIYSLLYRGYVVIPIPSYFRDDERRGFNHVKEMFKNLKLPMENILYKKSKHKQSSRNRKNRKIIKHILDIRNGEKISGKNVLLVDDVFTTGNTLKTAIELIDKYQPKKIEMLVISKTTFHSNYSY